MNTARFFSGMRLLYFSIFYRWKLLDGMPKYYNRHEWYDRGTAKIIPRIIFRRLLFFKSVLNYHVGDRVEFFINFDNEQTQRSIDSTGRHAVFEKFGDSDYELLCYVDKSNNLVIGNQIPIECSVTYGIGGAFSSSKNKTIIFTTTVQSWDTVRTNLFMIFVSAILGGVIALFVGIALGFIEFSPAIKAVW